MIKDMSFDFSFSGLKTAVKKIVDGWGHGTDDMKSALAREAEEAIVDVLLSKTKRAVEEYGAKTVLVGGGVSANDYLRKRFSEEFRDGPHVLFPSPEFATDNAMMIALAGYFHAEQKQFIGAGELVANGNLRLGA
jgi:N6-L-threonylcarbamoyladenine synthase